MIQGKNSRPKDKDKFFEPPNNYLHSKRFIDRFFLKVDKSKGTSGCWSWLGFKTDRGYGQFKRHRKGSQRAHRISFEIMYGFLDDPKKVVCHKCDNTSCVNPLHLFIGSMSDNNWDKSRKGRSYRPFGEMANCSKLKTYQVIEIKKLLIEKIKHCEIAKMFGVSKSHISSIKRGRSWGWL